MIHPVFPKMNSLLVGSVVLVILAWNLSANELSQEEMDRIQKKVNGMMDSLIVSLFSPESLKEMESVRAHLRDRFRDDPSLLYYLEDLKFSTGGRALIPPTAYTWTHDHQGRILISLRMDGLLKSIGRLIGFADLLENGSDVANYYLKEWCLAEFEDPRRSGYDFSFQHWKLAPSRISIDIIEAYAAEVHILAKAFIILHEIGHHKSLHLLSEPNDNAASRQRELEADHWAFTKMKEMGYPLAPLHRVLEIMGILEDLDMTLGRLPKEADSTHPSWKTRSAVLKSNFDLVWPKSKQLVTYSAFLQLKNPSTGGYLIKEAFLGFAGDPNFVGHPAATISFDQDFLIGAIERHENKAVIYFRPGNAGMKFKLTFSDDDLFVLGEVSGFPLAGIGHVNGQILGFKSVWPTHHAGIEIMGITLRQVTKFTVRRFQSTFRSRITLNAQEEVKLNRIEERFQQLNNGLIIRFYKGEIDQEVAVKLYESASNDFRAEVKKLLGAERSDEYIASIYGDPLVQAFFAFAKKSVKGGPEQNGRVTKESVVPKFARPGPVRAVSANIASSELTAVIRDKSFHDRYVLGAGMGYPNDYRIMTKGKDAIIIDRASGLIWQRSGSSEPMPIQKAKAWIEQLNQTDYFGYNDWRLPTMEELLTLAECEFYEHNLFISQLFDQRQKTIWSCDHSGNSPWAIDFVFPAVTLEYGDKGDKAFVRAVRIR